MEQHTILLIDDDVALHETLRDALKTEGFTVLEAVSGEEGIRMAFDKKPDLILLDIAMPQMNGYQVLRTLRKDPWGKDVKIILLSALDSLEHIAQGVDLSSDAYMVKSEITLESLIKTIRHHLAQPRNREKSSQ